MDERRGSVDDLKLASRKLARLPVGKLSLRRQGRGHGSRGTGRGDLSRPGRADPKRKVREKSEGDNCRSSAPLTLMDATVPTTPPPPRSPPPTTSQQLAAARAAADGPASLPVAGAVITYLRPTVGADGAGFFVQAEQAGPALFIAVDPGSLNPVAQVGDRVSFTVTQMATQASFAVRRLGERLRPARRPGWPRHPCVRTSLPPRTW